MTPWWWVSMLIVTLPVYVALRRKGDIWIAIAAGAGGLVLGAVLEGMLSTAYRLMTGDVVTFMDAAAKAVNFPLDFFLGLLVVLAGALNPELLFLAPRVVGDVLAGSVGSDLRRLKISLQVFELITTIIVLFVAAIHEHRAVRWTVIAAGSLAVTAAGIGAGYLHYKDQGIVVLRNDPPWLIVAYDINWAIVALLQTFIQICLAYFALRALIYLARQIWRLSTGSGRVGPLSHRRMSGVGQSEDGA